MFEYEDIKQLGRETGCRAADLIVLSPNNDPFYAGVPNRRERAEWFAELWDRFGLHHGVHLRRRRERGTRPAAQPSRQTPLRRDPAA